MAMISGPGKFFLIVFAAAIALCGCATESIYDPAGSNASGAQVNLTGDNSEYRLGVSDRLRIIVYDEPQISGEYVVNEQGNVSMALVGEVPAAGRTLSEFQSNLQARLAEGFLKEPRVSAEIMLYRPFYILGEVGRPGEYPYNGDLSIQKAVAIAGGYTYRANKGVVFIKRADWEAERKLKMSEKLRVYPGDVIRIGERFF